MPVVGSSACVVFAQGCPRSKATTARIFPYLQLNGWHLTRRLDQAALVIVAGCAFNDEAEAESLRLLHGIRSRMADEARLVVIGCMAGITPADTLSAYRCETVTPETMDRLDTLLDSDVPLESVGEVGDFDDLIEHARPAVGRSPGRRAARLLSPSVLADALRTRYRRWRYPKPERLEGDRVFHVLIARGCLSECAYCAIRFACGRLVSRRPEAVVGDFRQGLRRGFDHFELIAGDVGAYGLDLGTDLPALLDELFACDGSFAVDLLDVHPQWVIGYCDRLVEVLAARPGHLGLFLVPLQSGSDRILHAMRRNHRIADALDAIRRVMDVAGESRVETHVLVGFPGETDDDFRQTLDALATVPFHRIVAYRYCDRPGTEAARLDDKVPPAVIAERLRILRKRFVSQIRW